MNKKFLQFLACLITIVVLVNAQTKAEEENENKKVNYIYKYNTVSLKQPVITKSMQPGIKEYNAGNYIGAIQEFKDVIEKEKNNSFAKYYLALSYSQLGYRSNAQELFQEIVDKKDNYALAYYSERAMNCIDNMSDPSCRSSKKIEAPKLKRDEEEQEVIEETEQEQEYLSDIDAFIKSGKKIHPDANDKITNERLIRKMQADAYLKQQQEQAQQQEQTTNKKRKPNNTNQN